MVTNRARQKIVWIASKKFQICLDEEHRWRFWSAFRHFGTHFVESFRMSKSSWMMDPTRSREIPSCSAIDLAEVLRSSKDSSWIWSINSGVVTVLGRPGRGASQMEKSSCFNWATQFFKVAYDGARSPNISVRMTWVSFRAFSLQEKKKLDDSSRLDIVEIARVAWHVSFQPL